MSVSLKEFRVSLVMVNLILLIIKLRTRENITAKSFNFKKKMRVDDLLLVASYFLVAVMFKPRAGPRPGDHMIMNKIYY